MSRLRPFGVVTERGFVRQDVLDGYATKAESRQIPDQEAFEGVKGLLRPRHDPTTLSGVLDLNTAHARACRQKAQDVAGAGWRFDKAHDDAEDAERERLEEFFDELPPPANALDDDDLANVFEAAQLDYELVGRGVLELVRRDHAASGPLETIVHMPAHTVRIHRDKVRFVQLKAGQLRWFKWVGADGDVDWRLGGIDPDGRMEANRRANEIVWWKQYHPADATYGGPEILPALGAVHGDLARRDYNIQFFSNFGIPAYAVFVTGDFDEGGMVDDSGSPVDDDDSDAVMTELEWHIEQLLTRVRKNPHSSLVFTIPTRTGAEDGEVKVEFKPLSTDVKEASFRLYRQDNREEILSAHGMSSAIAGVFEAGAANRESMVKYKRTIVAPRQRRLERVVNRHIVRGAFGIRGWRWRLNPLDTRDVSNDLDMWLKLLDAGAVTLRELIRHFKEPLGLPEPGPDVNDPLLDVRRPAERASADGDDATAVALRSLRDDLLVAAKASGNGGRPALAPLLQ